MSPEGYELVLMNWARTVLYSRDRDQTAIRNVNLEFGYSGGCYGGHDPDEYYECDSVEPYIEATIFYFNGTKTCLYDTATYSNIDTFLKEVLECQP